MRRSIKLRLICGVISIITIPLLCIFGIIAYNIAKISHDNYLAASSTELERTSSAIKLFLDEAKANMDHLASYPELGRIDAGLTGFLNVKGVVKTLPREDDALGRQLRERCILLQKSHPNYRKVYLGSRDGGFISNSDAEREGGYDPRTRAWYKEAAATQGKAILSSPFRSTDGKATISAARAFPDASGNVLGVVSADISLSIITDMVETIRAGKTGFVVVAEKGGVIIADTKQPELSLKKLKDLGDTPLATLFSGPLGEVEITLGDKVYVANVFDAPEIGWRFVSCIEKWELMEPAKKTVMAIAWVALASLLLIIGGVWWHMDRGVIKPLSQVGAFLHAISDGRYQERLSLVRKDEIGEIFNALNSMAATLGDTIEAVHDKSREAEEKAMACQAATSEAEAARADAESARVDGMLEAADQLVGVVDSLDAAIRELSDRAQDIGGHTRLQRERIQSTASAMDEMNASVQEVAQNANQAADQGELAEQEAGKGATVVEESIAAMQASLTKADALKRDMGELDTQAKSIGAVMTVISDIADQTNLLALNAAIEAARAGEAGRGFAVVADEVRKLAEKTMTATSEVGAFITSIQRAAQVNVASMTQATEGFQQATDMVNRSGEVLSGIVSATHDCASRILTIAAAAREQATASGEINQSLEEINAVTLDTDQSVKQTGHALENLREQARRLTRLIEDFKNQDRQTPRALTN
ncbi:MAG: methyl-accepting chemotaxis protein [Solidesulfovibrio sp.]